jgi:hypothetical protein
MIPEPNNSTSVSDTSYGGNNDVEAFPANQKISRNKHGGGSNNNTHISIE